VLATVDEPHEEHAAGLADEQPHASEHRAVEAPVHFPHDERQIRTDANHTTHGTPRLERRPGRSRRAHHGIITDLAIAFNPRDTIHETDDFQPP